MLRSTDPVISQAVDAIYVMSKDEKIREAVRLREKRLHDEASALYDARAEGEQIGLTKGRAEGEQIGLTKGRAEGEQIGLQRGEQIGLTKGRAEGRAEGKAEILRQMKLLGFPQEQIDQLSI